jgi:predicted RNA-binding Zn-ribbon protein involved in translation (DUF1610 family)
MNSIPQDEIPKIPCPTCGEVMRLVGIERDPGEAKVHLLTFECPQGHYAVTTFSD